MTQEARPEPEFIETIIYELNNNMFLAALAGGIIIGGFAIYAYLQLQKQGIVPQLPIMHEIEVVPDPPNENELNADGRPVSQFGNYQEG